MKEGAVKAAALVGLMGLAAYYNQQGESSRVKRAAYKVETYHRPAAQNYSNFDDPSEQDLLRLLAELEWVGEDNHFKGDDQDVRNFATVRVNFKRIAKNKFGNKDWNTAFKAAHRKRYNALANFVEFNEYAFPEPASLAETDEEGNTNVGSSQYNGFDKTHPKIEAVLSETTIASDLARNGVIQEGNSMVGFVLPNTVPLNSDIGENLDDFRVYWQFVLEWKSKLDLYEGRANSLATPRLIIGRSSNKVVWQSRAPIRYDRRRFPWKRYENYNIRPVMQGLQPYIMRTALDISNQVSRLSASPSADKDCYFFWVHHEIGADINQLLLPESQELFTDLNKACTIMHIFVGFDSYDPIVQAYATALVPGLQMKAPLDNDFSGVWIVNKHAELTDPAFINSLTQYMTIAKHRAGCRCTDSIYQAPVTAPPPTGVAGTLATAGAPTDAAGLTTAGSDFDRDLEPTVAGVLEAVTGEPRVSVLDSCCGVDYFTGQAYDSELRTCCEDGKVKSWATDGSDPCGF